MQEETEKLPCDNPRDVHSVPCSWGGGGEGAAPRQLIGSLGSEDRSLVGSPIRKKRQTRIGMTSLAIQTTSNTMQVVSSSSAGLQTGKSGTEDGTPTALSVDSRYP